MESSMEMAMIRLRIVSPSHDAPYSLDELAQLTEVSPALVQRYFDEGLIQAVAGNARTAWFFDDNALFELRLIQRLRRELGVNIAGVAVIRELQRQIEDLKAEVGRLREDR
jgi:DNA-binding transcriptional MerR regulator